ncbi:MAG: hypothetical protein KGI50_03720 [Patescibacteria group bacterium]|nr:hypothetical protein [Patescibacteria group bacterium]MDE2438397.1 hypothetical protein [Patescibacteria group bacterium]
MEFLRSIFNGPIQKPKEPTTEEAKKIESTRRDSPEETKALREETQAETLLRLRDKISLRKFKGGGANATFAVTLKDDGLGIFKPKSGENKNLRDNVQAGTYFKRARAAYLVDKCLGFGIVPPVSIREIDGEIGSIQQFIENASTYTELSFADRGELRSTHYDQLIALWLFDIIIFNSDRSPRNLLVSKNGIHAIDNDLSFGNDSLRHQIGYYYNAKIPSHLIQKLERFTSSETRKQSLRALLLELLPEKEVNACISRIERVARLVQAGTITKQLKDILTQYE